jgi:hypothetical protein
MLDLTDPKRAAKASSESPFTLTWQKNKTYCVVTTTPDRVLIEKRAGVDLVEAETGDEIERLKVKHDVWIRGPEAWGWKAAGYDVFDLASGKKKRDQAAPKPKAKGIKLSTTSRGLATDGPTVYRWFEESLDGLGGPTKSFLRSMLYVQGYDADKKTELFFTKAFEGPTQFLKVFVIGDSLVALHTWTNERKEKTSVHVYDARSGEPRADLTVPFVEHAQKVGDILAVCHDRESAT